MTDLAFPENEFLTVKELAELLRLKERKIYDLAASGQVPCSRATGKLLFPAAEIRQWIEDAKSGGRAEDRPRPAIVLGSHDPLLDWAIRQSGSGLATYFDGSLDGLARFAEGGGVLCGLHVRDARTGDWNVPAVAEAVRGRNAVLVEFATRARGLIFRPDGPRPKRLADIAGLRLVPRQESSGTHGLLRDLAAAEGLDLLQVAMSGVARTEDEAVESVRRGSADVAFGLEAEARSYGLDFVPIVEEQFALLADRKAWFDAPLQRFLSFCGSAAFRDRAEASGGYDITAFGRVCWNA